MDFEYVPIHQDEQEALRRLLQAQLLRALGAPDSNKDEEAKLPVIEVGEGSTTFAWFRGCLAKKYPKLTIIPIYERRNPA